MTNVVRNLGVLLDSELSMTQHVAKVASVCFYHIRRLRQIRRHVGQEVTIRLVLAMVTTRLDYCKSATLSWQVYRSQRWNHCREFRTVQHVSLSISGIGITSRQLYSNCTGCQSKLAYSSSCVRWCMAFTIVTVRHTCLMPCSLSRSHQHEKDSDADRLKPQTMQLRDYGPSSASACVLACWPRCLEPASSIFQYLWNGQEIAYALSIGAKINDLTGPLRTVSKHMRLSKPTTKIWMKIDPYYQRRRCSLMTLDSSNTRFMRIFAVVLKIYVNFP